jgi:hypothetical protein
VTTDVVAGPSIDTAFAVLIRRDKSILAVGQANGSSGSGLFALARYEGDGTPGTCAPPPRDCKGPW